MDKGGAILFMKYAHKTFLALLVLTVMGGILAVVGATAAPPEGGGQDYVVQADDWLSKLADKFYGDPSAYLIIVEATNARAGQDGSYTLIDDPNLIEIGQKLFIPSTGQTSEVVVEAEEKAMPVDVNLAQTAPTVEQLELLASLDPKGVPPELFNEVWLNSEPLKLAGLHGKVVVVEFWTYGCINCINVLPALREWHHEYAGEGLVIIGVHTPEFSFEEDLDNVREALVRLDVPFAVAIDNDWKTWRSYKPQFGQRFWPTKYFLDKEGNVRHIHIGEGRYAEQEEIIKALLAEELS